MRTMIPHYSNPIILVYFVIIYQLSITTTILADNSNVYFDALSKILITGQYNGISEYSVIGQEDSYPASTASFIIQLANNNTYKLAGSTSTQGTINALCTLPRSSNNNNDVDVFIGGNYTSIGGITTNNIARYDVTTGTFFPLLDGLNGTVYSLYCDKSNSIVYVGGSFGAPANPTKNNINVTEFGSKVAIWNNGTGAWQPLPFKGFNGDVYKIAFNEANNTIYFGGSFDATGDGKFGVTTDSQPINMRNATVSGGNNAIDIQYGNPSAIICSADLDSPGNIWLLRDTIPGYWRAEFTTKLQPTSIHLKNTKFQGRGTKTFRLIATADNSVVNLTYSDPMTGAQVICTECPLAQDNQVYQAFKFVTPTILTGIQIDILEWYGSGGGLHGIRLFQTDVVADAVNDRDSTSCSSELFVPQVKTVGNWSSQLLSGIWEYVLQAKVATNDSTTKVTFIPYIKQPGLYNVTIPTVTCLPFGCNVAAPVDVKITTAPGISFTYTVAPNNQSLPLVRKDTYNVGFVLQTSDAFQPTVEITLSKSFTPPAGVSSVIITADFVNFSKLVDGAPLSGLLLYTPQTNQWSGFNGLLAPGSVVRDIAVLGQSLLAISGSFRNVTFSNIVEYDGSAFVPLSNRGLNGMVRTIEKVGDSLLVGGLFSGTFDNNVTNLNNLAKYNLTEKTWHNIAGGVNDEVDRIVLVGQDGSNNNNNNRVHVAGKFNTLISPGSNGNPAYGNLTFGYAIWDDKSSNWLQGSFIDGLIGDILPLNSSDKSNPMTFIAGNIYSAQSIAASGASLLAENNNLVSFPIYPQISNGIKSEIVIDTGTLWNDKQNNNLYTIIGGKFDLKDQGITNLAISKDNVLVPLNFVVQEEVRSLAVVDGSLFIGSAFTSTNNNNTLQGYQGFTSYGLVRNALNDNQPPHLSANDNIVRVNSLKNRLGSNSIIVSGKFDKAGIKDCISICSWDYQAGEWNSLASNSIISGEIKSIDFIGSGKEQTILIVAGNGLKLDGSASNLLRYDFKATSWTNVGNDLPGPSSFVAYDSSTSDQYFVSGYNNNNLAYIRKWNGAQYLSILENEILNGSLINSLLLLPSKETHGSNQILDKGWLLLISGSLNLKSYGMISAALFDGETIHPFIVASQPNGNPGIINSTFTVISSDVLAARNFLPVPVVIIISIAISFALVFLIVFIGMSIVYLKRKKMAKQLPSSSTAHRNVENNSLREKELLDAISAATAMMRDPVKSSQFK